MSDYCQAPEPTPVITSEPTAEPVCAAPAAGTPQLATPAYRYDPAVAPMGDPYGLAEMGGGGAGGAKGVDGGGGARGSDGGTGEAVDPHDARIKQLVDEDMQWANQDPNLAHAHAYTERGRVDPDNRDTDLAAAEHHLFARKLAGEGPLGAAAAGVGVVGYDLVKLGAYGIAGDRGLKAVSINDKPASKPTVDSVKWGAKGVAAGIGDYWRKLWG